MRLTDRADNCQVGLERLVALAHLAPRRLGKQREQQRAQQACRQAINLQRLLPPVTSHAPTEARDARVEARDVQPGQVGLAPRCEGADAADGRGAGGRKVHTLGSATRTEGRPAACGTQNLRVEAGHVELPHLYPLDRQA
jgi:hypothetical protein